MALGNDERSQHRPLHVLQVHNRYRRVGGEDRVVGAESELLREAGHTVSAHTTQNPLDALPAIGKLSRAAWNGAAARAVRADIDRLRPDVVHMHNTWFSLTPAVVDAARIAGVPVVMTLHNYRLICANSNLFRDGAPCEKCVGSHPWHGVVHGCYNDSRLMSIPASATIAYNRRRGTWEDVELFLALTPFARDRFVAGGISPERIRVRPHFVSDPGQRLVPPAASDEVVYVGRLSPEKGITHLVEAANRQETYRLVVVGDGPLRDELEREAGPRVQFTGPLSGSQVQERMRRSRVLAFPSTCYETFGLVLAEAMAAGLPILASDLGGSRDIVGDAGRLLPPGDASLWAAAFESLDDEWVDRTSAIARKRWEALFSPSAALPTLEASYRHVIAAARSASS